MKQHFIQTLRKEWWILILFPLLTLLATVVIVKRMPKEYESTITWIQPNSRDTKDKMSSLASLMGLGNMSDSQDPLKEIVTSTTFLEPLLNKDVQTLQGALKLSDYLVKADGIRAENYPAWANLDEVRKTLIYNTLRKMIAIKPGNVNTVVVTTSDPVFTRDLAKLILSQITVYRNIMHMDKATQDRVFLEQRFTEYENRLRESEQALLQFNLSNKDISAPSLSLQAQRLKREVETNTSLYYDTQHQLEMAKLNEKSEEQRPILLSEPETPLWAQKPKKNILYPLAVFVGGFFSLIWLTFSLWNRSRLARKEGL